MIAALALGLAVALIAAITLLIGAGLVVALGLAAGEFVYVAQADLVPSLQRRSHRWPEALRWQLVPLLAGILVVWLLGRQEA